MLLSDAAKPSATSDDKINGTQSLQHMLPAYKLSVYALQWLLPDTAQDSIIDVLGCTFDAFTFRCQLFYTSWRTAAFCAPLQKPCYVLFEVANITDKPIKQLPVTLLKALVYFLIVGEIICAPIE